MGLRGGGDRWLGRKAHPDDDDTHRGLSAHDPRRRARRPSRGASGAETIAESIDLVGELGRAGASPVDDRRWRLGHERVVGQPVEGGREPRLGLGQLTFQTGPLELRTGRSSPSAGR